MCRLCIACGTELAEYRLPLMFANENAHTMERNSSIWFVDKAQCVRACVCMCREKKSQSDFAIFSRESFGHPFPVQ